MGLIIHVGIALLGLWIASTHGFKFISSPLTYLLLFLYLYMIDLHYITRMHRRIRHEEKSYVNQKKLLSDTETVRWLNHSMKIIWPICLERLVSQDVLMPLIPWFLEKFKPWTAKTVKIRDLYLGRNPPVLTDVRVLSQTAEDDHLILEMGLSFLSAEDMSALLSVQMRKRLGFGMWTNLHVRGMHVEGKVRVGVKFLREWPFIKRIRLCFDDVPYFQMTVKPIFSHGVDVAELPGVASWLDKLLAVALEQSLVEPNMLVIDVERLLGYSESSDLNSSLQGDWFHIHESPPVGHIILEILEAIELKSSDLNGLSDPFVKLFFGSHQFKTKVQKKTLNPKWQEEFKIPISNWESSNIVKLTVLDKDHFLDDDLGNCEISVNDLRGGQRHDIWIPLQNVKTGRLHVAITVDESIASKMQASQHSNVDSCRAEADLDGPQGDEKEEININDSRDSPVWILRPGSDASPIWAHRKSKVAKVGTPRSDGNSLHQDCAKSRQDIGSHSAFEESPKYNNLQSTDDSEEGSSVDNEGNEKHKGQKRRVFKKQLKNLCSKFFKSKGSGKFNDESHEIDSNEPRNNELVNAKGDTGSRIVITDIPESIPGPFVVGNCNKEMENIPNANAKPATESLLMQDSGSPSGLSGFVTNTNSAKDKNGGLRRNTSFHEAGNVSEDFQHNVSSNIDLNAYERVYDSLPLKVSNEENHSRLIATSPSSVSDTERDVSLIGG